MNLPNKLTTIRMVMVPLFIACFYSPFEGAHALAAAVFSIAYITDIIDGELARRRNIVTDFGKLMDPIADKLLSSAAFIMLVAQGLMSPVSTILIIGREFVISGFRLVAAGQGNVIAAKWPGKLKTVLQFVLVVVILMWEYIDLHAPLPVILEWLTVVVTLWSGVEYVQSNKGLIKLQ